MKKSIYRKMMALLLLLVQVTTLCGCTKENAVGNGSTNSSLFEPINGTENEESQDSNQQNTSEADTPSGNVGEETTAVETQTENVGEDTSAVEAQTGNAGEDTSAVEAQTGEVEEDRTAVEAQAENIEEEPDKEENITEEQAILAIQNYCYINNPDLENIVNSGEYQVYWDVSTDDEGEIVVLFRSYTGAIIRYYIDPLTGDTYVTEFVPGITEDEERTDESFNVKDYMK